MSSLITGAVSAVCYLTWLGCDRYGVQPIADLDRLASGADRRDGVRAVADDVGGRTVGVTAMVEPDMQAVTLILN